MGELLTLEVAMHSAHEWTSRVQPLLDQIDQRIERHGRCVLEANLKLTRLTPADYAVFRNIYAGLTGRQLPEQAADAYPEEEMKPVEVT